MKRDPLEEFYDSEISYESVDILDLVATKGPDDNLCSAVHPDGSLISITGSIEQYTSPENVLFTLLLALSRNKELKVQTVLDSLSLDLIYTE
jgi:hypothetical protein